MVKRCNVNPVGKLGIGVLDVIDIAWKAVDKRIVLSFGGSFSGDDDNWCCGSCRCARFA